MGDFDASSLETQEVIGKKGSVLTQRLQRPFEITRAWRNRLSDEGVFWFGPLTFGPKSKNSHFIPHTLPAGRAIGAGWWVWVGTWVRRLWVPPAPLWQLGL